MVIRLLEEPNEGGIEQVAKDLITEIARMIGMRNTFVIYHQWPGGERGLRYGPFGNLVDAKSFSGKVSFGGTGVITEITSANRILANIEGYPGYKGYCSTCGHPPIVHGIDRMRVDNTALGKCNLTACDCPKWVDSVKKRRAPVKKKNGDDHD